MTDDWTYIKGFEGLYSINLSGEIRAEVRTRRGQKDSVRTYKSLILKPYINSYGYPSLTLHKDGKHYRRFVHRLLAETYIPNPDNKPCINHIDSDRQNNALSNLEWCTYSENNLHAYRVNNRINPKSLEGRFGRLHSRSKAVTFRGVAYESVREASRLTGVAASTVSWTIKKEALQDGSAV